MADLIDRAALFTDINDREAFIVIGAGDNICIDIADINKAPAVDAVPVVRCKDCKSKRKAEYADYLIANGVTLPQWIPVSERLPEDGEVVQIWCGKPQIARYKRGVSMAERDAMKRGELEDTEEIGWVLSTGCMTHKRSGVFKACDEWGNNAVPYNWESTCGPMRWFGQEVTHWMPLPEPPKEVEDVRRIL